MRRVLIADDEEEIFRLYKRMLGGRYELLWAKDGQDAIDKYKEHNPDLLLIDIMMPVKTGDEAIREIRKHDPDAKIVVSTGSNYTDGEFGVEVLRKGCGRNTLLRAIERNMRTFRLSYTRLSTSQASRPFLLR